MQKDIYDIALIGLGPAGSVLASLINKKYKVIAFDKKNEAIKKTCAGLLAPDAQKMLAKLGLTLPKEILVDPQIFCVETIDIPSEQRQSYQRFYVNIDRAKFDNWLMEKIPGNIEVLKDTKVNALNKKDNLWEVTFCKGSSKKTIYSKYVIGADGANSIVRKTLFPGAKMRKYLAIQQQFPSKNTKPFYTCVFDPHATDCYSWGLSKDSSFIFGGAYPISKARERFEHEKKTLKNFGICFTSPTKTEACLVLRPKNVWQIKTSKENAFLLGEAAGFISPSSLEGISWAMKSAVLLAKAFEGECPQKTYTKLTKKLKAKIALKLLKCPFMYEKHLRKIVMKSGVSAIKIEDLNNKCVKENTPLKI